MMHADRILKASLLALSFASLVGCANGGDSGSGGGNTPLAVKDGSVGSFTTVQSAPLENGSVPAALELPESPACAGKTDAEKSKYSFDDRLVVGDVFVQSYASSDPEQSSSVTSTSTVTAKTATSLTTNIEISNILIVPNPGFPIPQTFSYKSTCAQATAGEYPDCTTEFSTPPPGGGTNNSLSCSYTIVGDSSTWNGLAERGPFTLKSGKTVEALRVTQTYPITIKCKRGNEAEQDFGSGRMQSTTISTRELISEQAQSCNSDVNVYSFNEMAQDGGKILDAFKIEIFSAPVR
jgi:hypothetical protein